MGLGFRARLQSNIGRWFVQTPHVSTRREDEESSLVLHANVHDVERKQRTCEHEHSRHQPPP